jgi:cyclophilin family peptidyl-prolyl cis-trans isomerase
MWKFIIPLFALALLVGCAPQDTMEKPQAPPAPAADTDLKGFDGALLTGTHAVTLKTSKGDITLELDADNAPKTVTNFIVLAQSGYYDGLTFHRVIPEFMIQGGDPVGTGTGGGSIFGMDFDDEFSDNALMGGGYKTGVVAMANRGPNTNGSQFFIMDADYPLPPSYTIFGRVTGGQDVVHTIATTDRGANDQPTTPVTFTVEVK